MRKVLLTIGVACLLGALVVMLTGRGMVMLPHLLLLGLLLGLGVAFENWRYKHLRSQPADPRWQDTGERFVDPESGATTAVYFDPRTAERHYIVVQSNRH